MFPKTAGVLSVWTIGIITVLYGVLMNTCFVVGNSIDKECQIPCQSKECVQYANILKNNMNPQVNPCEDFFSFSCGKYLEKFGKDDTNGVYDDTSYSMQIAIKDLMDNLQPIRGSVSEKLKITYDNCMNTKSSTLRSIPDSLDFLNQIGISNWPNLHSNFNFQSPTFIDVLSRFLVYGEFAFIKIMHSPYEDKTTSQNALPSALILPDEFLLDGGLNHSDVKNIILKVLYFFNVSDTESNIIWEDFKSIEDTGIKLLKEQSENVLRCIDGTRNSYAKLNCSEERYETLKFLCSIWKSAIIYGDLNKYYSDDILYISCRWNRHYFLQNIFTDLFNVSHKSLAHYLALRFFVSHMDDTNLYFHLTKTKYLTTKEQKKKATVESISRWEYCTGWLMKSMNIALGHEYTQKIITEPIQNDIITIIEEYIQELNNSIQNQKWINSKVKVYLQIQLGRLEIGFKNTLKIYKNKTDVEKYYEEFQPVKGSFLKTILAYKKISTVKKSKTDFNSFHLSSDSYLMDFGLALFLPPFYSYGLPKIWNYAALGWIIAHELSHNLRLFFDLVQLDEETGENLRNRTECYIKQYSDFILKKVGKSIKSKETEEEVIADNIGWFLTEKIFKKYYLDNTADELTLPGLPYTSQEIMYISFAQACCSALSKKTESEFYSSNPQRIQKLQVSNVLQNSRLFSETYNCSSNTFMNPETKCTFF